MNFRLCFTLFLLVSVIPAIGQNKENATVFGTIYGGVSYAAPLGDFRQKYPGGWAAGATFGTLIKPYAGNPLELGAQVGYLTHGIDLNDVGTGANGYTLKTAHSFIPVHGVVRFKPRTGGKIVPYLDGLAGITVLNTRTKIKEPLFSSEEDDEAIVIRKANTTAFSYGLAAGLHLAANKKRTNYLDIRVVYLEGGSARYVRRGQFTVDAQGYPNYKFTRSETSMLLVQLNFATYLTK